TWNSGAGTFKLTYQNGPNAGEEEENLVISVEAGGNVSAFQLSSGDKIRVSASGSGKDAGSYGIIVSASVAKGAAANYVITTSKGSLVISPVPLIVVTDSASKEKDGQALTAGLTVYNTASGSRVKVSEENGKVAVVAGEILTFTATGSQTNEGESKNTYSVAWGSANEKNYTLTDELGTLLVSVNHTTPGGDDPEKPITIAITITADSANKAYDGTPLTATGSSATGLPEGYMYSATCSGSQITAGTGSNTITSYKIFDASDKDVTEFLTNVTIVDGALTVTPANLTVVTSSASKVYDGTPLTCSTATISGLANGETASVTATGTITDVGVVKNTYTINWGTFDAANYTVSENLGTLTIEKLQMQVQWSIDKPLTYAGFTLGASHGNAPILTYVNGAHGGETLVGVYLEDESGSGTAASNHSFELFTGDKMAALFSGGGIDVGTYSITGSGKMLSGKASNYQISYSGGSLEIIPVELIIKTESASRGCDGTTLTAGFTVSRIPDEGGEPYVLLSQNGEINFGNDTLAFAVTGSQAGMGSSTNTYSINWNGAKQSNYSITEELGTLTIEKVKVTAQWQPDKDPFDMDWEFHSAANGSMVLTFDNIEQDSIICEDPELLDPDEEDEESKIWIFKFALPALPNLPNGAELSIKASGGGMTAGTYTISTEVCKPFAGSDYYEVTCTDGKLNIGEVLVGNIIRITTGTTFKHTSEWDDAAPLTNASITIEILTEDGVEVDEGQSTVIAETTGSLDHIGKAQNTYRIISWGEVNPDNYTIEENLGLLIIYDTVIESYGGIIDDDHTRVGFSYDPGIPIENQLIYKVLDFDAMERYIQNNFSMSPEELSYALLSAGYIASL
ncbi:MAG: hypothetical protein IIY45_11680, partial [Firmicutes bacterium]|nr:hypothetical protein [Bacillota bacterium]